MSEEEKRALEFFKNNLEDIKELGKKYGFHEEIKNNEILLNYIDKLQIQVEESEKALVREREFKNKEIDRLQKENEELKDYKERTEHTIKLAKATQRENEELQKELEQEKENNRKLKDHNVELGMIIGSLNTDVSELKEKNASMKKEIKLMKSININDNFISKDKIKQALYKDRNCLVYGYKHAFDSLYNEIESLLKGE